MEGTYKLCYGISLPAEVGDTIIKVVSETKFQIATCFPELDIPPLVWYNAGDSK